MKEHMCQYKYKISYSGHNIVHMSVRLVLPPLDYETLLEGSGKEASPWRVKMTACCRQQWIGAQPLAAPTGRTCR